jgi:hypothetical protein
VSCPYCHADNRTDITYSCWTKVGDDELARSERCLRNEIKQHKERIRRLEEAGDYLCAAAAFMGWHDKIEAWNKAKEAKQ